MPKSTLTIAELEAAAILIGRGAWYDWKDHTFMIPSGPDSIYKAFCADTMAPSDNDYDERCRLVRNGEIGAADYGSIHPDNS